MAVIQGDFSTPTGRFALLATRFNAFIVEHLLQGARDALLRHGVAEDAIDVIYVPGAWELPQVTARLLAADQYVAIIALGCVIRGATPHFDYVAGETAKGLSNQAQLSGVPVAFGVLTTDTIEQAIERAGTKAGNKGTDAAMAALEMANLYTRL